MANLYRPPLSYTVALILPTAQIVLIVYCTHVPPHEGSTRDEATTRSHNHRYHADFFSVAPDPRSVPLLMPG